MKKTLLLFLLICIFILFICVKKVNLNYKISKLNKTSFSIENKNKDNLTNSSVETLNEIKRINEIPQQDRTIFISVASYRDDECPNTINEIFTKAKFPNRIFVGICQQNSGQDKDCFNPKYKDNIRIIRFGDKEAKGPTYARYMCSKLYHNENYFMQIDSHTHFETNYDEILVDMLPPSKVVLTTYPNDWITEKDKPTDISVFCSMDLANGMLKTNGLLLKPTKELIQVPFVAAGFFFTYGIFLKNVPYDPDLPHLFQGEEILFTIRLWTNGWNFYAPNRVILYHYYTRSEAPKYWENPEYQKWQPKSFKKAQYMLKLTDEKPELPINYGFGTERSLEDYYNFIGFDVKNKDKKITKKFCG